MKIRFFLIGFIVLALANGVLWSSSTARAQPTCDPAYVTQAGNTITVQPTGVSDTANLQCAFDAAVSVGTDMTVHLESGIYKTDQIVVTGFQGQFTGEGASSTTITNLPNLYVTPVDVIDNPPSADNPWPNLISFIGGDFSISHLAVRIQGDKPALPWTVFGIDPPLRELAHAIVFLGTEAHVRVDHVLIEGEHAANTLFGYNLIQAFFFEGLLKDPENPSTLLPISGSFSVQDSTFRSMDSGAPVYNLNNATVIILNNEFSDMNSAVLGEIFPNSSFEFSKNNGDSFFGVYLYNTTGEQDSGSSFLFNNNNFRGAIGVALELNFGEGNECLLKGNNTQNVEVIGIYLGPGTTGCTVVGGSNKTNVLDLGTDNILVGVNNMGTGVGPTLTQFLRPGK